MALSQINESTTLLVDVSFWDEDGVAAIPSSATYRIDDVYSGTVIQAATSMGSMAATITVEITAAQNALIDATQNKEERIITVDWRYGSNRRGTDEYRYVVKNLTGVP